MHTNRKVSSPIGDPAAAHLDLRMASQSRASEPAADSGDFGMDGKKDCIFILNSASWKRRARHHHLAAIHYDRHIFRL